MYLIIKEVTRYIMNHTTRITLGYKLTEEEAKEVTSILREREAAKEDNNLIHIEYYYEKVEEYKIK